MAAVSEASVKISPATGASASLMRVAPTTSASMARQVSNNAASAAPAPTAYQATTTTSYSSQPMTYPAPTHSTIQGSSYASPQFQQTTTYPTTTTSYPTTTTSYPTTTTVQQTTSYPHTTTVTSSYPQGNTTSYPQGNVHYPSTAGSLAPHDSAIQNAINQGRIYAPMNSIYVPGPLALKSGMNTIYDSKLIPTFEMPLNFQSSSTVRPIVVQRDITEASHLTGKSNKFVVSHQKKSACC